MPKILTPKAISTMASIIARNSDLRESERSVVYHTQKAAECKKQFEDYLAHARKCEDDATEAIKQIDVLVQVLKKELADEDPVLAFPDQAPLELEIGRME
jgi:hypothetical protein